jgi:energy-converting hydrogenase Eha subunit A
LIQTDSEKITYFAWKLVDIFTVPIVSLYSMIILKILLGWSFIFSLILLFIGLFINSILAKKIKKLNTLK